MSNLFFRRLGEGQEEFMCGDRIWGGGGGGGGGGGELVCLRSAGSERIMQCSKS